ncbi:hypothetical protein CA830_08650 [Burkholderia multivorans]|nr:hypothetical protein CA831_14675 [Burkholderia multivorans]OXH93262.1 hypothetical protein CA830_08650 [Burkholderia multivorans]
MCSRRAEGEAAWRWSITDDVARSESRALALLRIKYNGKRQYVDAPKSTATDSRFNASKLQTCRRSNAHTASRIFSPYARNRAQAQRIRTAVDAIDTERCA